MQTSMSALQVISNVFTFRDESQMHHLLSGLTISLLHPLPRQKRKVQSLIQQLFITLPLWQVVLAEQRTFLNCPGNSSVLEEGAQFERMCIVLSLT